MNGAPQQFVINMEHLPAEGENWIRDGELYIVDKVFWHDGGSRISINLHSPGYYE